MKREQRELPGVLHFVVLNFQNQHFWLIRDHMCKFFEEANKKKEQWSVNSYHQRPQKSKTKLPPPPKKNLPSDTKWIFFSFFGGGVKGCGGGVK